MFRLLFALLLTAFLSGTVSSPALAQALCGDRSEILESLDAQYGETPQAIGLSQDGGLLEVLVSPAGGWTILVTYPKRPTCVVATGRNWESHFIAVGQPV
jgi:hypothetical protein